MAPSQITLPPNATATAVLAPSRPSSTSSFSSSSNTTTTKIFLAGPTSTSTPWRQNLATSLSHLPITFYDPFRPDWDSSSSSTWTEDPDTCPAFREQTDWELEFRGSADVVVVMFDKDAGCEVTLLEFGLSVGEMKKDTHTQKKKEVVVCCPQGFKKRGNVKMVCEREGVEMVGSEEGLKGVVERVVKARNDGGGGGGSAGEGPTVLRERTEADDGPVNPKKRMMF